MISDLNLALTKPLELIQSIYEKSLGGGGSGSSNPIDLDKLIHDSFKSLFSSSNGSSLNELPLLTSLTNLKNLPPNGTLIKFRGMIQDTGLNREVYNSIGSQSNQVLAYGKEESLDNVS